jgi:GNAT superfamily N-acetyltransferase
VSLSIRTAEPDDLISLQTIYRQSSLSNEGDRLVLLEHPEHLVLPAEAVYEGRARLAEDPSRGIVGFATVERCSNTAELVDLFVTPESMRRGVGRALINDAVAALADDGIPALWVTANRHALAFYLAMGFEAVEDAPTQLGSGTRMLLRI